MRPTVKVMSIQSCAGMSMPEAASYEGHITQEKKQDRRDQVGNKIGIHRVGNRPSRVYQMSMATRQRHAGSSSRELRIVIHEEVRLEC